MGPNISSFFSTDDEFGMRLWEANKQEGDLMWPLPMHEPYRKMLDCEFGMRLWSKQAGRRPDVTAASAQAVPQDAGLAVADVQSCGSGCVARCILAAPYLIASGY